MILHKLLDGLVVLVDDTSRLLLVVEADDAVGIFGCEVVVGGGKHGEHLIAGQ